MTDSNNNKLTVWNHVIYQESIIEKMSKEVKGQTEAVSLLAYVGYLYSLELLGMTAGFTKKNLPKLTTLITGRTGFGKTFLVRTLAESMEVPYIKIDMSTITGAGWQGPSMTDSIKTFLEKSPDGYGIIHLDEIDKIGTDNNGSKDIKGDLQQQLLELLDGDFYHNAAAMHGHPRSNVEFSNANNALIILTGSFQGKRDDSVDKRTIGFSSESISEIPKGRESWKNKLDKMGFMKEFAARIVNSIELQEYNEEQIRDIVLNSEHGALNKYKALFGQTSEAISDEDIDEIVKAVHTSKDGIRELESLVFEKYFNHYKRGV